jgi:hypothetical protein
MLFTPGGQSFPQPNDTNIREIVGLLHPTQNDYLARGLAILGDNKQQVELSLRLLQSVGCSAPFPSHERVVEALVHEFQHEWEKDLAYHSRIGESSILAHLLQWLTASPSESVIKTLSESVRRLPEIVRNAFFHRLSGKFSAYEPPPYATLHIRQELGLHLALSITPTSSSSSSSSSITPKTINPLIP